MLTERYYCDGVTAGDIDRDGHQDVVAGPFWYAGPEFTQAHEFYPAEPLPPETSPSNSMFSFVHDFSGDGWPDILVLGRVHKHAAAWYESPGDAVAGSHSADWQRHFAFERVRGESPTLTDIDGDGRPELLCHWDPSPEAARTGSGGRWGWIAPDGRQPRKPWSFHAISPQGDWNQFYHGEGVGDVDGDGRADVVLNDGWFEQPETLRSPAGGGNWEFHRGRFSEGRGGAQIYVDDVDADGDADVISALDAHGWGLSWFEQTDASTAAAQPSVRRIGELDFVEHRLMGDRNEEEHFGVCFSQPHALALADVDGDDLRDIVVGKRLWAHGPTGDVEPNAPAVLYWFQLQRGADGAASYVPHLIDDHSGVGVQLSATDLNGDGRADILTASKLGTFVFLTTGKF